MAQVTKNMTIAEILQKDPGVANFFFEAGMHCLGCAMASGEDVEQAAVVHGIDADKLIDKINTYLENK